MNVIGISFKLNLDNVCDIQALFLLSMNFKYVLYSLEIKTFHLDFYFFGPRGVKKFAVDYKKLIHCLNK